MTEMKTELQVVFFRHTIKQLLLDGDIGGLVYRALVWFFRYEGPTHCAVRVIVTPPPHFEEYPFPIADLEYGHAWFGSYTRHDTWKRCDSFWDVLTLPTECISRLELNQSSRDRTKLSSIYRAWKGYMPEGMTCVKWVVKLLNNPYIDGNTTLELRSSLLQYGAVSLRDEEQWV